MPPWSEVRNGTGGVLRRSSAGIGALRRPVMLCGHAAARRTCGVAAASCSWAVCVCGSTSWVDVGCEVMWKQWPTRTRGERGSGKRTWSRLRMRTALCVIPSVLHAARGLTCPQCRDMECRQGAGSPEIHCRARVAQASRRMGRYSGEVAAARSVILARRGKGPARDPRLSGLPGSAGVPRDAKGRQSTTECERAVHTGASVRPLHYQRLPGACKGWASTWSNGARSSRNSHSLQEPQLCRLK